MTTATTPSNPFTLMTDPQSVRQLIDQSESLRRLSQRQCRPLDKAVIRSPSAELAAYDAKIDRTTVYLPPEQDKATGAARSLRQTIN